MYLDFSKSLKIFFPHINLIIIVVLRYKKMYNPTMIDIVGGISVWEARMLLPRVSPPIKKMCYDSFAS